MKPGFSTVPMGGQPGYGQPGYGNNQDMDNLDMVNNQDMVVLNQFINKFQLDKELI